MKTSFSSRALAFGLCLMALLGHGQVSYLTNDPNANAPLGFIGWNVPNDNTALNFRQNNFLRLRMTSVNWPGYNSALTVNRASRMYFGINDNVQVPFSMMHLGFNINQVLYRPWMNVGTTYGAGSDIMYTGMIESPGTSGSGAVVDAVVAWGCNDNVVPDAFGPDHLRFLFLGRTDGTGPPSTPEGLETMRITPWGNVGIGDFSTMPNGIGPSYGQPRARLDVQFRNTIPGNTNNTAVNILNQAIDPTAPLSPFKIGVDATVQTNGEVIEAIAGRFRAERGRTTKAVYASAFGAGTGVTIGVEGDVQELDGESKHFAIIGRARNAIENVGVYGSGFPSSVDAFTAGVVGQTAGGGTNTWAGWFNGRVYHAGALVPSDESLKHQIDAIENASGILYQLSPRRYYYNQNTLLNLPSELQYGLLAQQVEEILPSLVSTITAPGEISTSDDVENETITIKAIRYNDLIAILIAGFQEQAGVIAEQAAIIDTQVSELQSQAENIASLQAQLETMQLQMASMLTVVQAMQTKTQNCCIDGNSGAASPQKAAEGTLRLEQNIPNPFDTHTRIDFTLPADARVVLELSDINGRPLRRLIDGPMKAGAQTLVLDGSALAPGTYLYTVYADGQMVTKKMVKK